MYICFRHMYEGDRGFLSYSSRSSFQVREVHVQVDAQEWLVVGRVAVYVDLDWACQISTAEMNRQKFQ